MNGCIYRTEADRCLKFTNGVTESFCALGQDTPCGYRTRSKGDQIRDMSDYELAALFNKIETDGRIGHLRGKANWLNWLRKEEDA